MDNEGWLGDSGSDLVLGAVIWDSEDFVVVLWGLG